MEIGDIVYLAFATVIVIICLHLGAFWVSRVIQPPKARIVYVDRPTAPPAPPLPPSPPPQPIYTAEPTQQTAQVPTYEQPPIPQPSNPTPPMGLPPPIETRATK